VRYVLDCSVAVKWFVPESLSDAAEGILAQHESGEISFVAPNSIAAEFGHALRKLVLGRALTVDKAVSILQQFLAIKFDRVSVEPLAVDALTLSVRHLATFYDALYISLAIREDLKVVTADERMVNAFAALDRTISLANLS
jgi:predicted nucleic acid-binding protein